MKKKLSVAGALLLFCFVTCLSGLLVCGARARNVPSLQENQDVFRRFAISPERLSKAVEEKSGYETLTEDFLFHGGELGEEETEEPSFLFCTFLRRDTVVEYAKAFESLLTDLSCFPVGKMYPVQAVPAGEERKPDTEISFEDSWGGARSYGGERRHEGTDLMPSRKERGYYPVVSVSDGVVEKLGWLKLGGYRVGVRAEHGAYFYYAHLDRYEEGMKEGKKVKAGAVLGYMGDSGYGAEGTVGKFQVHLHFGVYLTWQGREVSVNPYPILQYLDQYKIHKVFYQSKKL